MNEINFDNIYRKVLQVKVETKNKNLQKFFAANEFPFCLILTIKALEMKGKLDEVNKYFSETLDKSIYDKLIMAKKQIDEFNKASFKVLLPYEEQNIYMDYAADLSYLRISEYVSDKGETGLTALTDEEHKETLTIFSKLQDFSWYIVADELELS